MLSIVSKRLHIVGTHSSNVLVKIQ